MSDLFRVCSLRLKGTRLVGMTEPKHYGQGGPGHRNHPRQLERKADRPKRQRPVVPRLAEEGSYDDEKRAEFSFRSFLLSRDS